MIFGDYDSARDMGLQWIPEDGQAFIPEARRNEYEIAGQSGTLLMPGDVLEPFEIGGSFFPLREPESPREMALLRRKAAAWLGNGRQRLIFDDEPELYYMAELTRETKWSLKTWFGGEIKVKFLLQPYAYRVFLDKEAAYTTDADTEIPLMVHTGQPAPLCLRVENAGAAALTRVRVGEDIDLGGLSAAAGQHIEINGEPPIGAAFSTGKNALPYAEKFRIPALKNGLNRVRVRLEWGAGEHSARITVWARGRY